MADPKGGPQSSSKRDVQCKVKSAQMKNQSKKNSTLDRWIEKKKKKGKFC